MTNYALLTLLLVWRLSADGSTVEEDVTAMHKDDILKLVTGEE